MITATVKVKNGLTKLLPKELRGFWENGEAIMRVSPDTLIFKKVRPDSFWQTWKRMKPLAGGISKKDIQTAVAWARNNRTR